MTEPRKKLISTFLKIGLSLLLLYFVFTKISFAEVWSTLKKANPFYLILGTLLFILSQWVSARRLLLFFYCKKMYLSERSNNVLYLIGMFYNFFIPGGIGGDAYKVYLLNRKFRWSVRDLSAAVFLDRFMGLTAIGVLVVLLSYNLLSGIGLVWLIPLALVGGVAVSYVVVRKMFPSFLEVFSRSLLLSLVVQLLQVLVLICIIFSLEDTSHILEYVFIFLISTVLSIFSFSGIGVREFIFYQASQWLMFDPSTAVSIGLLFSVMTAVVSSLGIFYHFKSPEMELRHDRQDGMAV